MDCTVFCEALGIRGAAFYALESRFEKLTEDWEGKIPFFMEESFFTELYPFLKCHFPLEELLPRVRQIRRIAEQHQEIALLGHILCKGSFEEKRPPEIKFENDCIPILGEEYSGMFSILVSLGAYPYIVKAYGELGIPEQYAKDVLAWIGGTMLAYGQAHNGLPGRGLQFAWIVRYITKTLFRIGRLEYLVHPAPEWLSCIYCNDAGDLKVLCGDKWHFRADKRRAGEGEEVVYSSFLEETGSTITGIGCDPYGVPDFEHPLTLDKSEYHSVLTPWDICPSIHIPAGGRMPIEEVFDSMKMAVKFFQTYFKRRIPMICCCSWILNPAWEFLLENSNMARFRKECYALPSPSWGPLAGMGFLFGRADVPPEELPAVNTAQKAFQEASKRGLLGTGAIFVLTEDLEKLGNEYYRKKYGSEK
ncbi:MAG: hypothetical protein J6S58_07340 [Lentisphaeria bacterium]|nr:hypothetical protein [Lentisphaeria bacterium]